MTVPTKPLCLAYVLLWGVTATVTLRFGGVVPAWLGYVLIATLFLPPLLLLGAPRPAERAGLATLVATTFLVALVVVDPVERGFYGYDVVTFTLPALRALREASVGVLIAEEESWPALYLFVDVFRGVTGATLPAVAKYLPLAFVTLVPVIYYVAARRLTGPRLAGIATVGVASVRTLYLFETKLVDETIAVPLLFLCVALVVMRRERPFDSPFTLGVIAVVGLAHHVTAIVLTLLMGFWVGVSRGRRLLGRLPRRFRPLAAVEVPFAYVVVAVAVNVLMFLFAAGGFTDKMGSILYASLLYGQTTPVSGGVSSPALGVRQSIARGVMVLLLVMAALCAYGVLSRYRERDWELAWVGYAAVLSVIYAATLVWGRSIPLDPIRLFLFLVPMLLLPALAVLITSGATGSGLGRRHAVAGVLVAALVITQLVAIPPHVLYSDPGTTVVGEGHYTPAQFETSDWVGTYSEATVVGWESELWRWNGAAFENYGTDADDCGDHLLVWRREAGTTRPQGGPRLYDAGDVSLHSCEPTGR